MKRHALPLFVAAYVIFGVALLLYPSANTPHFTEGKVRWNPFTEKMTIRVTTRHAVINLNEIDLSRTEFVCDHPDTTILLRVTGGKPTHLTENLPDNVMLVNPAGVFAGPDTVVKPGGTFGASVLELGDVIDWKEGLVFPDIGDDPHLENIVRHPNGSTSAVELKAYGNVYALAVRREGRVGASENGAEVRPRPIPGRTPGRIILSAGGPTPALTNLEPYRSSTLEPGSDEDLDSPPAQRFLLERRPDDSLEFLPKYQAPLSTTPRRGSTGGTP